MRTAVRAVTSACILVCTGTAAAHHSPAAFDRATEVRIEGTLTKVAYNNPHIYLTVDVMDASGTPKAQVIEAGPISTIQPLGLMRDSLRVGERVVVRANPSRRGAGYTVLGLDVRRADGKTFPLNITSASVRPASTAVASSLAGTWRPTLAGFSGLAQALDTWPWTEEGRQRLAEARQSDRTPQSDCIPAGAPMLMVYPVATRVEVGDRTVVFDIDWLGAKRVVHLDVAAHAPGLQPTLQGHSIGRWEGGTLVVETAGFAPHAEGIGFGIPSSDGKRLVERFTLDADRRHLNYHVTLADPRYLTQPVEYSAQWEYSPDLKPSGVECDVEVARRYLFEANAAAPPPGAPPDSGPAWRRTTLLAALAGLFVAAVGLVGLRMRRRVSRSNVLRCLPLLVSGSLATVSAATDATKIELHLLRTTTLSDQQFLTGSRDGTPVTIAGELRVPAAARTGRVPAMVIVHGSGGISAIDDRWSRELLDRGFATFLIDGFTLRGITSAGTDQSRLGLLTMINDAYRALELLAADSRVDPARIGIMGGSRRGRIALYASLRRFQRLHAAPGTQFAVYLPFYAPCGTTYVDDTDVADRPIRLFHGTADDSAPIAACRAYVERLRRAGKDVQLTEYEGAHHAFDYPDIPTSRRFSRRRSAR